MKKRQIYFLAIFSFFTVNFNAQIGVNTSNPQGIFNIDAAKDNPITGTPTAAQQANDILVTPTGNMGVGIVPTNKLHVAASIDPLRLEGTTTGVTTTDRLMVLDATGIVKTIGTLGALSIPSPAIFRLETAQSNFLNGVAAGGSSIVPMSVIKNTIPGMSYDSGTSTITFPSGTYQMTLVYEALHNATG